MMKGRETSVQRKKEMLGTAESGSTSGLFEKEALRVYSQRTFLSKP